MGCVRVTNSSGSNGLQGTLEKLAEECENVGRQWGATGYFEQNGLFIKVKLWKNQPGRVKHKTVTYLTLRYPAEGPGYGENDQT